MRHAVWFTSMILLSFASPARAQDRDHDRVPDALDLCPDASENAGAVFPGDGCPDTDGDHDGIVDDYDACPGVPETANGLRDLDGCPDALAEVGTAVASPGPDATRAGCFDGASLFDLAATAGGSARIVPRAGAPTWMGTRALDCYAGILFDGRRALHCAADGPASGQPDEATVVMRVESGQAVGFVAVRRARGIDRRAWSGTPLAEFDPQELVRAIEPHTTAFQDCYERELRRAHGLAGRVSLALTMETSGRTSGVRVTSDTLTPARPSVAACLVRVLESVVLAHPPRCSPVTRTFPFVFEQESEEDAGAPVP